MDRIKVRLQAGKTCRIDLEGSVSGAGTLSDPAGFTLTGTGEDDHRHNELVRRAR